jgi:hypothetical protein
MHKCTLIIFTPNILSLSPLFSCWSHSPKQPLLLQSCHIYFIFIWLIYIYSLDSLYEKKVVFVWLIYLTWFPAPSTFLQATWLHPSLWLDNISLCTCTTITNSGVITWMCKYPYCMFIYYFWYMPRNGITGSYTSSILVFWEASILISIVTALVYIPTNSE